MKRIEPLEWTKPGGVFPVSDLLLGDPIIRTIADIGRKQKEIIERINGPQTNADGIDDAWDSPKYYKIVEESLAKEKQRDCHHVLRREAKKLSGTLIDNDWCPKCGGKLRGGER